MSEQNDIGINDLISKLKRLENQQVIYRRIAADELILYFYGEPGDQDVVSIWISPPWRYEHNDKIVLGSFDLIIQPEDYPSKTAYTTEFERLCSLSNALKGSLLNNVQIDKTSLDLTLELSDEQIIRSFCRSPLDQESWSIVDVRDNIVIEVGAGTISENSYETKPRLKLVE